MILCIHMWGANWAGQRITIYCDNDSVCEVCTNQKSSDQEMQKLLHEFLFWVCRYNFYPVLLKISSKDNFIADFISRNHDENDISEFFSKNGYQNQSKVVIPSEWYSFVAEW